MEIVDMDVRQRELAVHSVWVNNSSHIHYFSLIAFMGTQW